jgi:hypothetical protein
VGFLDEYIQSTAKKKKNKKKSYAEWLTERGSTTASDYSEVLSLAHVNAAGTPTYGAKAEELAAAGLSGSGYAAYLSKKGELEKGELYRGINERYNAEVAAEKEDYYAYSDDFDEDMERKRVSVIENIKRSKIVSFADAYALAVNKGLSEEEALAAAKSGTDAAVGIVKEDVIQKIFEEHLTYSEAHALAKSLGLEDEDAKKLGEFAKQYSGYGDSYGKSYSEYLKKKLEKQKQENGKRD